MALSRRRFLRDSLVGLSAVSLSNLSLPGIGFSQSGGTKALVVIQLGGGMDPWLAFPYTTEESVVTELRGNYARIPPAGLLEIAPGLGVHPGMAALVQAYPDSFKVIMQTGNGFNTGVSRSHEIATQNMITGGFGTSSNRLGWTGRLFDQGIELHGFGADSLYFTCQQCASPPFRASYYEAFDISSAAFGGDQGGQRNATHVDMVLRDLNRIAPQRTISSVEELYRRSQTTMFDAVDDVRRVLQPQFRTQFYDAYSVVPPFLNGNVTNQNFYRAFAQHFRNIAQKLKQLKADNLSERIMFVFGLGSFDTHDRWLEWGDRLMWALGSALKLFRDDLAAEGLDQSVITYCSTEFGRTISGNGTGTDHGIGYPAIVTGGAVNASGNGGRVYGEIIPATTLRNNIEDFRNAWPRQVSQERLVVELIEKHLGMDGKTAFPSPLYEQIPLYADLRLVR